MKPQHFQESGYHIINHQEFGHKWGLGSSSSIIVNIARWSGINPLALHYASNQGSGYDVACAMQETPIVFQLKDKNNPEIFPVKFDPPFKDHLYFAYLGEKKDTARSVSEFLETKSDYIDEIEHISRLTKEFIRVNNVYDCIVILSEHEKILSSVLAQNPVGEVHFSDFKGQVKSLGAWGGDFVMLVTPEHQDYVEKYMFEKQVKTWFTYNELIGDKK